LRHPIQGLSALETFCVISIYSESSQFEKIQATTTPYKDSPSSGFGLVLHRKLKIPILVTMIF
jgi:hypothetical protein